MDPWIDPQMRPILEAAADTLRTAEAPWTKTPEAVQRGFEESMRPWNNGAPPLREVRDETIPGPFGQIPVRVYSNAAPGTALPGLVYFHGGGWVAGSPRSHDAVTRRLAAASGARLLSIDYGLAPGRQFPDTHVECLAALRAIHSDPDRFAVRVDRLGAGGDSAGANLALACAQELREAEEEPLRRMLHLLLLLYPALSPSQETDSFRRFGHPEFGSTPERFAWFWDSYVPRGADRDDPRAVPMLADPTGLPGVYLLGAGLDPMVEDLTTFAGRLVAAGVPMDLRVVPGVIHGFLHMAPRVTAAARALEHAGAAVAEALGG